MKSIVFSSLDQFNEDFKHVKRFLVNSATPTYVKHHKFSFIESKIEPRFKDLIIKDSRLLILFGNSVNNTFDLPQSTQHSKHLKNLYWCNSTSDLLKGTLLKNWWIKRRKKPSNQWDSSPWLLDHEACSTAATAAPSWIR